MLAENSWDRHGRLALATLFAMFVLPLGTRVSSVAAAEQPSSAPAAETSEPGLALTFVPLANDAGARPSTDSRVARLVALYVPKGLAPSPFTPAEPFRATFQGDINMRLRDFVVFSAAGRGKLTVTIGGKAALDLSGDFAGKPGERVRLGKGKNHLIATYESPADGDAELRLFWSSSSTLAEPVPPMVFTHSTAAPLAESLRVREGRFLFANLRCNKCHAVGKLANDSGMPELAMDAPSFDEIGGRLSRDWMASWIDHPREMRPGSHMPRIFTDDSTSQARAQDAAAYLASLSGNPPAASNANDAEAVTAGGRLFAHLNCVACHTLPDAPADAGRVSLAYVKAKFLPEQIRQYLVKPESHYAWNPMPDFRLSEAEATELAAYLASVGGSKVPAAPGGDAGRGKALVQSSGCLSCHKRADDKSASPAAPALEAIAKEGWTRGCMAADKGAHKNAPDFALSDDQRAALAAFAVSGAGSMDRDATAEFAERQVQNLRCTACHSRDGTPSLLSSSLESELNDLRSKYPPADGGAGEAFAPDQRAPLLTWAGEKLRPKWMGQFIAGQIPFKPRPYLRARMPGFGAPAELLAAGLASEHGCATDVPPDAQPDLAQGAIGQKLVGKAPNQSLGCIQCHAVANQPPIAPFEAPALNFNHVTERLRKDYYFRWVHDPMRVDPETKMPRFDDADGKTSITDVLGGDAHQQFEAIWQYFLQGRTMQPPAQ